MNESFSDLILDEQRIGESSSQYAYRILFHNIMYFNLLPGEIINDSALTDVLKISRTPIREAIFRLREDGLIDIYAKNKTIVSYIDYQLLEEGLFIRASLESAVIKDLCGNLNESYKSRLDENLKIQCLFAKEEELKIRFFEYDNDFHHLLFLACNKNWAWQILQKACTQLNRVRYMNISAKENIEGEDNIISNLYEDHHLLFKAIVENNPQDVDNLIAKHINRQLLNKWRIPGGELSRYIINIK